MNPITRKVGCVKSVSGDPVPKKPEEVIEALLRTKQTIIRCILSQVTFLLKPVSSSGLAEML